MTIHTACWPVLPTTDTTFFSAKSNRKIGRWRKNLLVHINFSYCTSYAKVYYKSSKLVAEKCFLQIPWFITVNEKLSAAFRPIFSKAEENSASTIFETC
jgi:hypothetical protein